MATEKKFLAKALHDYMIKAYLEGELRNAGVSTIQIQKTPLATRIAIRVKRPSMVIGKKGATVKAITEKLEKDFGVDNPQLDIIEVENPNLDAKLVAEKIARQIEIEGNMKQIMRINLRDVVESGAIGVEIIVSGKVVGKGGKAKALRMRKGFLKKSGELKKLIDTAKSTAYLKAGAIGVTVKIVHPGTIFPDAINIDYDKIRAMSAQGDTPLAVDVPVQDEAARFAELRMKEIEKAKAEAKAKAERRRKFVKPVKKKPAYEAENLIKSAEIITGEKPKNMPEAKQEGKPTA
ncbi:MAG: 30S ribosomal protein S3 [Candidatus Micrarchaeota archaeon]